MKKLLLSLFASTLVATSFAQNVELGINGGIMTNMAPSTTNGILGILNKTNPFIYAPNVAIKLMNSPKKWQFGLSLEYRQFTYREIILNGNILQGMHLDNLHDLTKDEYHTQIKRPGYVPLKGFINRKFTLNKLELYAGVSAGLGVVVHNKATNEVYYDNSIDGYAAIVGLQTGATYYITRRIGINAELAADYTTFMLHDYDVISYSYSTWAFPATVGVRYKF